MDKKIVLIAFIGLITVNQSCTNKTGGQQPQSTDFDSVAADSTAELDSLSPYWYDKNQTEVIFSDKKDTLYRFPREKMGGIYSIPYTVKYIEERAFMGCKEIEEVYIPQSVEHIEMAAFENCQKLEYVYMTAGSHIKVEDLPISAGYKVEYDFQTTTLGSTLRNYIGGRANGVAAGGGFRLSKLASG